MSSDRMLHAYASFAGPHSPIFSPMVPGATARGDPGIQQFVVGPIGRDFTCSWDPQMIEPWEGRTREMGEMRPELCIYR